MMKTIATICGGIAAFILFGLVGGGDAYSDGLIGELIRASLAALVALAAVAAFAEAAEGRPGMPARASSLTRRLRAVV